jgi:hypothetical protein
MDVYIQSQIGECSEFIMNKEKQQVNVVISPLRIHGNEDDLRVISGCNLWKACENPACYFSKASRSAG